LSPAFPEPKLLIGSLTRPEAWARTVSFLLLLAFRDHKENQY
jgi:hypothetical protein